jgi:transcriptional antiterminator RfaH
MTPEEFAMSWYAVHTKPRQEILAQDNLKKFGLETFCPLLKQDKLIRRRWQSVTGPLFPGYLFTRFNLEVHYRAVNYSRGVKGVVAFGSVPARVDEAMIESIKSRIHDGCVTVQPPSFTPGQAVRIQEGPFQGLAAVFEQEMDDHQRVVLLLQALSYQARVIVDRQYVVSL